MATSVDIGKFCCKCGVSVSGAPRMKDSGGRYWCYNCGKEDKQRQSLKNEGVCSGCGESFTNGHMTKMAGQMLCDGCLKQKYRNQGLGISTGGKGKLLIAAAVVAVLVLAYFFLLK